MQIQLEDEEDFDSQIKDLYDSGNYAQAVPLARKAVEAKEKTLGPDHPEVAAALNNLAWLLQAQGDYPAARQLFERALKTREAALPPDHPDIAVSLNNLAALLAFQGDRAAARPLYERALQINERNLGPDHPDVAASLNNLAALLDSEGLVEKAIPLYQRALSITEKSLPPDHPELAGKLNNLATIYGALGHIDESKKLLERALSIREKALGPQHPDVAESLNNLGMINRAGGNLEEARQQLDRALEIYETVLGPEHLDVAIVLNNLGEIERQLKGEPAGTERFLRAAAIIDNHVQKVVPTLSLAEQRAFLDVQVPGEISFLLSNCRQGKALEDAYGFIFRWKGVLIESLRGQTAVAKLAGDKKLKPSIERLQSVRTQLAGWYQQAGQVPYVQWKEKNDALTSEKERLERELSQAATSARLEDPLARQSLAGFAGQLGAGGCLVDLYQYELSAFGHPDVLHFAAVIIAPGAGVKLVDLGLAAAIHSAVANWRREVLVRSEAAGTWTALKESIWKPIASACPAGSSRIWVCPDGELARIPWQLLPGEGGRELLAQVDSPRELCSLLAAKREATQQPSVLLAGGIEFGAPVSLNPGHTLVLKELPGSLTEVESLKKLADKEGFSVDLLTGGQATKQKILALMPTFDYCHLATHGFFFNQGSVEREGRRKQAASGRKASRLENARNPLVESGIALAGANAGGGGQTEESGLLTAEELVGTDLSKCRLLTLSACETGRGTEVTGQGVMGLRAAIMAAGAESVVMSLWKVPDLPTLKLMDYFYTNLWEKKLPKAEALKQAQIAVRNEPYERYKSPVNWAGWVLVGSGW